MKFAKLLLSLLCVASVNAAEFIPKKLSQQLDVHIVNPVDGQILQWDNATAKWINATNGSSLTFTGDVSGSGTSPITLSIGAGKVTSGMILDGTIVNADINASAGIVDTKLATIGTAGKVSNSATTATNANTASAIVARDASGNFTAGTITANLTGNASTATALAIARNINGVAFDGTANITIPITGYSLQGFGSNLSPADGTNYFFGSIPAVTPSSTEGAARVYIPKAGTIKAAIVYWNAAGTAGSNESFSCAVRLNGTTDISIASIADTNAIKVFSNTGLSTAVSAGDYIEFKILSPTWATNPTTVRTAGVVYIE